jgi:cobalamin synthase
MSSMTRLTTPMTQSRLQSFIEAWSNTLIGYFINLAVQLVVYPFYGATFSFGQNIQIGLIFMVVSMVRSYVLRRVFNARVGGKKS